MAITIAVAGAVELALHGISASARRGDCDVRERIALATTMVPVRLMCTV